MNLSLVSYFSFPSTYGQGNHNLVKQEIKRTIWDFLGGSVVKIPVLLIQVGLVQSMVGKLRSHMLHGTVKKKKRERERENCSEKDKLRDRTERTVCVIQRISSSEQLL